MEEINKEKKVSKTNNKEAATSGEIEVSRGRSSKI